MLYFGHVELKNADHKTCIASIDSEFECNEVELREEVSEILQNCTKIINSYN